MKLTEPLFVFILLTTTCLEPRRVNAEEKIVPWKGAPKECRRPSTECVVYPTDRNAQFYKSPSTKDPVAKYLGKYRAVNINDYLADPGDLKSAQWVRLYHIDIGNSVKHFSDFNPIVWVERQNLLRYSDLRPVARCWRIKHMSIQAGDAPGGTVEFKRDGTGVVTDAGRTEKVRAWYKNDVFSIRYVASGEKRLSGKEFAWGYVYSIEFEPQVGWIAPGRIEDLFEYDPAC